MNIVKHLPIDHRDERGIIQDIFKASAPDAVTLITLNTDRVRGNHYHRYTRQWVFVMQGTMWAYSSKAVQVDKSGIGDDILTFGPVDRVELVPGDLLEHDPNEAHAYEGLGRPHDYRPCMFLAFATGIRKGSQYEDDTYRIPSLVDRYKRQQGLIPI